jgi:hypothetical protein
LERYLPHFAEEFLKFGEVVDGTNQNVSVIAGDALEGPHYSGVD